LSCAQAPADIPSTAITIAARFIALLDNVLNSGNCILSQAMADSAAFASV